jgi:hypothetical protein
LVFLFGVQAKAQFAESTENVRGVFCLGFHGLYDQSRLLNQDGTYAHYKGAGYGGSLDVKLFDLFSGEFRVYGIYNKIAMTSTHNGAETLKHDESIVGIKLFTNSIFFVSGGLGRSHLKLTNEYGVVDYEHSSVAMGGGLEIPLGNSNWHIGFHGYYKTGAIPVNSTNSLSSNSFRETGNFSLNVIWSPSFSGLIYSAGR